MIGIWVLLGLTAVLLAVMAAPAVRRARRIVAQRKRDSYPLPKLEPKDQDPGVPVSSTVAGIRFRSIVNKRCPHCRKQPVRFVAGPVGGMSQNIQCEQCHWWFNVTVFPNGEGTAEDIGFKDRRIS